MQQNCIQTVQQIKPQVKNIVSNAIFNEDDKYDEWQKLLNDILDNNLKTLLLNNNYNDNKTLKIKKIIDVIYTILIENNNNDIKGTMENMLYSQFQQGNIKPLFQPMINDMMPPNIFFNNLNQVQDKNRINAIIAQDNNIINSNIISKSLNQYIQNIFDTLAQNLLINSIKVEKENGQKLSIDELWTNYQKSNKLKINNNEQYQTLIKIVNGRIISMFLNQIQPKLKNIINFGKTHSSLNDQFKSIDLVCKGLNKNIQRQQQHQPQLHQNQQEDEMNENDDSNIDLFNLD